MQSKLLSKNVLSSILALGALTVSSTALANSGGEINLRGDYVGLYPDGSNVIVDMRIDGIAYGSYGDNGILSNNTVTVSADCRGAAGAEIADKGNAENNSVIIENGTNILKSAIGAIVKTGNATGNRVIMNGGNVGSVYGVKVETGNATGNSVIVNDGTVTGDIYGAYIVESAGNSEFIKGTAANNSVLINGGNITGDISGAFVKWGDVTGNSVVINNSNVVSDIYGALVDNGSPVGSIGIIDSAATNNRVVINNSNVEGEIYGANIKWGDVTGNCVVVDDSTVENNIYSAFVGNGNAIGNRLIINGGKIKISDYSMLFGGQVNNEGEALGNRLIINDTIIIKSDNSNNPSAILSGGFVSIGTAADNIIVLSKVNNENVLLDVRGALLATGKAENNGVIIDDGKLTDAEIAGAIVQNNNRHGTGNMEDNYVIINNSDISGNGIYGAKLGLGMNGAAANNSVVMDNSNITSDIYGAKVENGNVTGNFVVINDGKITGTVYGGYTDNGKAEGNVITISGDADLSEATLIAGYEGNNSGKLLLSDNTSGENIISINGWSGSVEGISGTDVIEINGSKLTDNGIINITSGKQDDLSGTIIKVNSIAGGQNVAAGDTLKIITSENNANLGVDVGDIKTSEEGIMGGVASSITGEFKVDEKTGEIVFEVNNVQAAKQTAITTETRAAAAAMVNQGSEVIADSISKLQYEDAGVSTFATISGNNSKYKTGSYVDINGWNGIVGAAKTVEAGSGKLSYGAFFENGSGNYNTYNDFNGNVLRGDGNAVYNGGGLLMRYAKENGVYTEVSVRAGLTKNEVSNALAETSGKTHGFKTENTYYGAHVGIGKLIKLEKGKSWDIYGKYFYTHHEGDSVTIANDSFDFDAIDSSKLRLGVRFSEQQGDKLTSYYGLAWEYEFSGDVGGTAAGHMMYTPSLEGSTVIGEVGFRYTPGKASPWYFDANVKGYAGMQQGISGSVQAVYSF